MQRFWLLLLLVPLAFAPPAAAQGVLVVNEGEAVLLPGQRGPRPPLPPRPAPSPVSIKSQQVDLRVESGVVHAQTQQTFVNSTSRQLEGTYLFALPEGATVSNFRMQVGREPVDGQLLTVEEARRIYEAYVRRRVDPGILEFLGDNTYRARVFPILPAEEKPIQITYSHPAEFQNGVYRIHYPLRSDRVHPEPLQQLEIKVTLRSPTPIRAVYSPTHEIVVRRHDDREITVTYDARQARLDRDFQLYYTVSEREFGAHLIATRPRGEDGTFLLMLAPPREVAARDVAPRDVVCVFDTSGSMHGDKIIEARQALRGVLETLNPGDRFAVIRFSTDVEAFRPGLLEATPQNVRAAQEFIAGFRAEGGTALHDALLEGLETFPARAEGRQQYLIFMTDGMPTIGERDPARILKAASDRRPDRVRLFSFGVGYDVNAVLLDRLARDNGGAADYVAPDEDLQAKIAAFSHKIAHPVLADLTLELPGADVYDLQPREVPDLFAGQQLLIAGRYRGSGRRTLTLTGELNGQRRSYRFEVDLPAEERGYGFVSSLWANRKIGVLLEEIRLHGENEELKNEVIRLSKEFGIVTPYTAYLVEEPELLRPGTPVLRPDLRGAGPAGPVGPPGAGLPPPVAGGARGGGFGAGQQQQMTAQQRGLSARAGSADAFRQQGGALGVEASRAARELADRTLADTDVELRRTVQGRAFRWERGAWRDAEATEQLRRVAVKYGSEAYFAILDAQPEWWRFLALGASVELRTGPNTVLLIGEEGAETLTEAEIRALTGDAEAAGG